VQGNNYNILLVERKGAVLTLIYISDLYMNTPHEMKIHG